MHELTFFVSWDDVDDDNLDCHACENVCQFGFWQTTACFKAQLKMHIIFYVYEDIALFSTRLHGDGFCWENAFLCLMKCVEFMSEIYHEKCVDFFPEL